MTSIEFVGTRDVKQLEYLHSTAYRTVLRGNTTSVYLNGIGKRPTAITMNVFGGAVLTSIGHPVPTNDASTVVFSY